MSARIVLLLLLLNMCVYAVDLKAPVDPPVRLCATEWPPFTININGRIDAGISVDVIRAAFARLHRNVLIQNYSWILCRREVREGRADALIDATPAESELAGSNFYSMYPLAVFVPVDSPVQRLDTSSLRDQQVGMVRGYLYGPIVASMKGLIRVDADNDEQLMVWLKHRRIQYVISDLFAAPALAERIGVEIRALKPLIEVTPLYLSFNPRNASLAASYNLILGEMIADGTVDAIYARYLPYNFHEAMKRYMGN